MKIVQSTWTRFHHFDLARELEKLGCLEHIFTCLPWWKANLESKEQNIPRSKISCNFLLHGIRRVAMKMPGYNANIDFRLGVTETKFYSKWVANKMGECDTYIALSGSGLQAGRVAKSRGSGYIMDRGSSQARYQDDVLTAEYKKWKLSRIPINPWLIENEEAEAYEAHIITVPSNFAKQTFIEYGTPSSKIRVVPYGVALDEFYPVAKPDKKCFCIVFVGHFSIRKGALYLLEAFKKFKHPNKELLIIGSVEDSIKDLINILKVERVKFIGIVPRNRVKEFISLAQVLVLPSIEDGFGLVITQAMACGCPVIASNKTGANTIFENEKEGMIVEAGDIAALVIAFNRLADEPSLRQSMSEAALKKVKELGGWKDYAKKMLDAARDAKKIASVL